MLSRVSEFLCEWEDEVGLMLVLAVDRKSLESLGHALRFELRRGYLENTD